MGQDPGEIREEIERTREQLSETADAIAYKVDIGSRAREQATRRKDEVVGKVRRWVPSNRSEATEQAKGLADYAKARALEAKTAARSDPRGAALIAGTLVTIVGGFVALVRHDRKSYGASSARLPSAKKATSKSRGGAAAVSRRAEGRQRSAKRR